MRILSPQLFHFKIIIREEIFLEIVIYLKIISNIITTILTQNVTLLVTETHNLELLSLVELASLEAI